MKNLTDILGIDRPIIQAPMAGVQGARLAAAVSGAGGLGSLPAAMLSFEALESELQVLTAIGRPYNVNFFCHTLPEANPQQESQWRTALSPYYQEFGIDADSVSTGAALEPFSNQAAGVLESFKTPVVSFQFGLPSAELLARVKNWGAKVMSSATTVSEAIWLEQHGADLVIAQGLEAGGHRGMFLSDDVSTQVGTLALLPQILKAVSLPVVAAGGIANAGTVAALMGLGASGVQIGTAYLLCPEADTSKLHRAALKGADAGHTALTNVFTGRPARGIVNRIIRELGPISPDTPAFPQAASALAPLRAQAESNGSAAFTPLWSGQNNTGCKEIPAAELTRQLASKI